MNVNRASINLKKLKSIRLIAVIFAVLLAFAAFHLLNSNSYSKDINKSVPNDKNSKKGPAAVEITTPQYKTLTDGVDSVGTLLSEESVVIAPEIAGKVTGIYFKEGSWVKAGQVLVKLDDSVLKATLDSAVVDKNLAQSKYKRAVELIKVNGISQQDMDSAYAEWQRDEAAVRLAKAQLDKAYIRAPFSGIAGTRQVSPGSYLQAGTQIVNLEAVRNLKIQFNIPQTEASKIRSGQSFTITADDQPGSVFTGKIYAINPKVDESSRSLVVKGIIDNSRQLLRPGLFVQVHLTTGAPAKSMFVPESAINPTAGGKTVLIYKDGTVSQKKIETGKRITGWVEVLKGLTPEDQVVTKGQAKDGDKAEPVNKAGGRRK